METPPPAGLSEPPVVVDRDADRRFRELIRQLGFDPDDTFTGGYVSYEWGRARHYFEGPYVTAAGARVLELGCHLGGTALVLAALGADVSGIDVDARYVEAARANAARHGLARRAAFLHVPDTSRMPFDDGAFDVVSCASVLEYVREGDLPAVLRELDRVLRPGGKLVVLGTSNRLWPREVHHRRWLVNYIPPSLDRVLFGRSARRGVWPWSVRLGFPGYRDLPREDAGRGLIDIKTRQGGRASFLLAMRAASRALTPLGAHHGYVGPHIATVLQKP